MDTTVKKRKSAVVLACILLLACLAFFVTYGLFVYGATMGDAVTPAQVVYTFYAYGGFTVICLAAVAVIALSKANKKAVYIRIFLWGIILLAYHFGAQFFANIFNFALMTFQQGLIYVSEYIPSLCLVATLIAVLCQWNAEDKKLARAISWVGLLASAFLSGWFIYYKLTSLAFTDAAIVYEALFGIAHAVVIPLAIGFLFNALRNEELFKRTFLK